MADKKKTLYLRLIEREEPTGSDEDRLKALQATVAQIGLLEWFKPPSLDPKGGFTAHFIVTKNADIKMFIERLDESGYWSVF